MIHATISIPNYYSFDFWIDYKLIYFSFMNLSNTNKKILIALLASLMFGCASSGTKTQDETPEDPAVEAVGQDAAGVADPSAYSASSMPNNVAVPDTIYFSYDSAQLDEAAKEVIKMQAEFFLKVPGTISITGHCDERGTDEYNLALGYRRANSVKKALIAQGVPANRFTSVMSKGKSEPIMFGHDESSWKMNRRAKIVLEEQVSQ